MSKKLINSSESVADEALAGLVVACPGLQLLQGHRVIVRADVERVVADGKVTLLSGGGSGHEPAQAGYVGLGMLTASVSGAVFASPPPGSILAALRAIHSPAGTVMIVTNYTGDRLNFGIALERARREGMRVELVVVGEDCALPDTGKTAGRRGLCGTILVHKIAGGMAEKGCSLDEIVKVARRVAAAMGTMSVSLSPCSVPGHRPSFTLAEEDMELGLGIHGEAGAQRTKLQPAKQVVQRMVDQILSKEKGFCYFNAEAGSSVALVVNNLGGTSNLELLVVLNEAIRYLVDQLRLSVDRVVYGSLMTSLEMAGVSLTLLKLEPEWEEYIDLQTAAPGWPQASCGANGSCLRLDSDLLPSLESKREEHVSREPTTSLGVLLRKCVSGVCEAWISEEETLNSLDRGSGDGECGSTLKAGALGVQRRLAVIEWDYPVQVLLSLASAVEADMGGSSGAIYNLFLSAAARALEDSSEPLSWARAMQEGMNAIMRYGGAKVGDRTMFDALSPAIDVLVSNLSLHCDHLHVLQMAVKAAEEGVALTGEMREAGAGRASYVHSSQLSQPDPGARAVAVAIVAIYKQLSNTQDCHNRP